MLPLSSKILALLARPGGDVKVLGLKNILADSPTPVITHLPKNFRDLTSSGRIHSPQYLNFSCIEKHWHLYQTQFAY
jgi:hypothetical protein